MPIAINGSGTVTGISAGGLPDGVITADELATAVKPLGVSQTWTNVAASRVAGTTYTNSTGRPILVFVSIGSTDTGSSRTSSFTLDGSVISLATATASNGTNWAIIRSIHSVVVPDGSTYSCAATASSSISYWYELR